MSDHMFLKLNGAKKKAKRLGRGYGSTRGGHTVGRGTKGQKARSKVPLGFEGGQVPLYKKIPQIAGFINHGARKVAAISLERLNVFDEGAVVTPASLKEKNILRKIPRGGIKILATGKLNKKLVLEGFSYSVSSRALVESSGSEIK
jgi:large subunit ribosomal protein L15